MPGLVPRASAGPAGDEAGVPPLRGLCRHDHLQQPLSQGCRGLLLLHWQVHSDQSGAGLGAVLTNQSAVFTLMTNQEPDHCVQCAADLLHAGPENLPGRHRLLQHNSGRLLPGGGPGDSHWRLFVDIHHSFPLSQEDQSGSFSMSGTVYGVLASLFVSLFSIFTKKV